MTSISNYLVTVLPKFGIPKPVLTKHLAPDDSRLEQIIESLDSKLDPKRLAAKMVLVDPEQVETETKQFIRDTSPPWNDLTANNSDLAIILPIGEQKVSLVRANGDSAKPVSIRFFNDGLETVFNPDDNPDFRLEPFKNKHLDEIKVGSPIYNDLKELVIRYEVQTPEARTQTLELMNEIIKPFAEQSKTKRQSNTFNSILMEHPFSPNIDLVIKLDNKGEFMDISIYEPLVNSDELKTPNFFLIAKPGV